MQGEYRVFRGTQRDSVVWTRICHAEEKMGTHSSILARRTPWTEESGGLQSTGSQKVRHNSMTEHMWMQC